MSQQEEGWPLGLQPVNVRIGNNLHSVSFNTLLTASPSSTDFSSSDLDTESTGSFFHDRSTSLGSLIGVSNIIEFSRKSSRVRKVEVLKEKKINKKPKTWFFSLCSRDTTDAQSIKNNNNNDQPSLGHFLAVERRAATYCKRNGQSPDAPIYGPGELSFVQTLAETNSLFVNGHVAPPRVSLQHENGDQRRRNGEFEFSCMCGQSS